MVILQICFVVVVVVVVVVVATILIDFGRATETSCLISLA